MTIDMEKFVIKIVFLIALPTIFLRHLSNPGPDYLPRRQTPRVQVFTQLDSSVRVIAQAPVSDIALQGASQFWAMDAEGENLHHLPNGKEELHHDSTPIGRDASLSFIDQLTGWAFAPGTQVGILWKTVDGGESWQEVSRFEESQPDLSETRIKRLKFVNKRIAWLYDSSSVWRSLDGGERWQLVFGAGNGPVTFLRQAAFVDEKTALITTSDGIYVTSDGGQNWKLTNEGTSFEAISASDQGIWAINSGNELVRTVDRGKTWRRLSQIDSIAQFQSLHFINHAEGWAAGSDNHDSITKPSSENGWGVLFHTTDGGKTWTPLGPPKDLGFERVVFANSKNGWLIGVNGLYRTTDAGRTWEVFFERRSEIIAS